MLDAYDRDYSTDEWDPQERDAMAREAQQTQSAIQRRQQEEWANELRRLAEAEQAEIEAEQDGEPQETPPRVESNNTPIRQMARNNEKKEKGLKTGMSFRRRIKNPVIKLAVAEGFRAAGNLTRATAAIVAGGTGGLMRALAGGSAQEIRETAIEAGIGGYALARWRG